MTFAAGQHVVQDMDNTLCIFLSTIKQVTVKTDQINTTPQSIAK